MQRTAALMTIETKNSGGKLGKIGIVIPEHRYLTLCSGTKFDKQIFPGAYPASTSDDAKTFAEHKAEINEFETYKACMAWARQTIVIAVNKEWISELKDEDLGYQLADPLVLLKHLRDAGGDLDDMEIMDLNTQMLTPWDGVEAPVTIFARADKFERQLKRFGILKQPEIRFLHAALGFPTKATLLTAIRNGNLVTFPGLTTNNVSKHFSESDETQKGHMKQTRQGNSTGTHQSIQTDSRPMESNGRNLPKFAYT
ncbi:hypothetical protein ACHAW6_012322 [Cyclotella cf. meneghiniana]